MQQIICSKWTADELTLMDELLSKTGALSRSQLLRLALLALAEDHQARPDAVRAACKSRLDHPYRRTLKGMRAQIVAPLPPTRPTTKPTRKRR